MHRIRVSDVWILLEVVLYENIFPYIVQLLVIIRNVLFANKYFFNYLLYEIGFCTF